MPPSDSAEQVNVTPAVSVVTVCVSQPVDVTSDSGSVTVQVTVTSDVYQPPLPRVPDTDTLISGGVESFGFGVPVVNSTGPLAAPVVASTSSVPSPLLLKSPSTVT